MCHHTVRYTLTHNSPRSDKFLNIFDEAHFSRFWLSAILDWCKQKGEKMFYLKIRFFCFFVVSHEMSVCNATVKIWIDDNFKLFVMKRNNLNETNVLLFGWQKMMTFHFRKKSWKALSTKTTKMYFFEDNGLKAWL